MTFMNNMLLSLLILLLCSCGSSSDKASSTSDAAKQVAQPIEFNYSTPGNGLPEILYTEAVTISGTTMTVTRNGGAQINSGTWVVELRQRDVAEINGLLSLADNPAVTDYIIDNIPTDASHANLLLGNAKEFHHGIVVDPIPNESKWHEFPVEATNLVNCIDNLMLAYVGGRYK